jgi:hypothetical protein
MNNHPPAPPRRRALEAAIRIVDLVVYAGVFGGGAYVLLTAPSTLTESLQGYYWLIVVWSILLGGGGLIGFLGRLTRYWLVETPATIAAAFGIGSYLVVLSPYLLSSYAVAVLFIMALTAMAFMVRRWLELQIFATEPGTSWRTRLTLAANRRTQNTVNRSVI